MHPSLNRLLDDQFLLENGLLANPLALRAALLRSSEVRSIRSALAAEEIDDELLRKFVSSLLDDWQAGRLFAYDVSLAALAVAVESRATRFAEQFLNDLAKLHRPELPMAVRVARHALREHRRMSGTKNLTGNVKLGNARVSGWQQAPILVSREMAERNESFDYGAA